MVELGWKAGRVYRLVMDLETWGFPSLYVVLGRRTFV